MAGINDFLTSDLPSVQDDFQGEKIFSKEFAESLYLKVWMLNVKLSPDANDLVEALKEFVTIRRDVEAAVDHSDIVRILKLIVGVCVASANDQLHQDLLVIIQDVLKHIEGQRWLPLVKFELRHHLQGQNNVENRLMLGEGGLTALCAASAVAQSTLNLAWTLFCVASCGAPVYVGKRLNSEKSWQQILFCPIEQSVPKGEKAASKIGEVLTPCRSTLYYYQKYSQANAKVTVYEELITSLALEAEVNRLPEMC